MNNSFVFDIILVFIFLHKHKFSYYQSSSLHVFIIKELHHTSISYTIDRILAIHHQKVPFPSKMVIKADDSKFRKSEGFSEN